MEKVNIQQKFNLISDYWAPKIIGEVNDAQVKAARLKGEFVWHSHEKEDEMFLVIAGHLKIKFRDREIDLQPGEFLVIPKGVEHLPVAEEEVQVLLFEPKSTINTGNVQNDRTIVDLDRV